MKNIYMLIICACLQRIFEIYRTIKKFWVSVWLSAGGLHYLHPGEGVILVYGSTVMTTRSNISIQTVVLDKFEDYLQIILVIVFFFSEASAVLEGKA